MKYAFIILTCLIMNSLLAQETTTIYFIRHAEKANASSDPALSTAGKERAQKWAEHFLNKYNIDAVYATKFKRTQQTAKPLAEAAKLEIVTYNPADFTIKNLIEQHHGTSVLVVGHSNMIPKYINDFVGEHKFDDIAEDDYGTLFIITVSGGEIQIDHQKL